MISGGPLCGKKQREVEEMNLRPHHLLCIQKFTGHGYDAAFTSHMTHLVARLAGEPTTPVTLTRGCDDLCGVCPNNMDGACTTLEKVAAMDGAVLTLCGLAYGETVSWAELADKGRKQIFETEEFSRVCGDCEWFELCKSTANRDFYR